MKLFRKIKIPRYEYDVVFGSRKVIKDPNNPRQEHFYDQDIWTEYGKRVAELIPEGFIVYGELVGWTPDGAPLQKNYTYQVPKGDAELFVYRVSTINQQGTLSDLSWDGVREFCRARGLKWVPEIARFHDATFLSDKSVLDAFIEDWLDTRFSEREGGDCWGLPTEEPLKLSDKKTVDEGVCLRQEGLVPLILKAKSPEFLLHETKLLDAGTPDIESAA